MFFYKFYKKYIFFKRIFFKLLKKNKIFKRGRFLKPSFFLFLVLFLLIFSLPLLGKSVYPEGPYFEAGDKFYIAADAGFTSLKTSFADGETVYVRVETQRVSNAQGANNLEALDYLDNVLRSASFTQVSTSPYTYEASFVVPSQASYFILKINLQSSAGDVFLTEQALEKQGVGQYMKIYKDADLTKEHYVFKSTDVLYWKAYGDSAFSRQDNESIYDFQGGGIYNNNDKFSQNGSWYSSSVNLADIYGLTSDYWYYLKAFARRGNTKMLLSSKMFYIDDTLPQAEITAPGNNSQLEGAVDISGSADDASFSYYKLEYEDQDNLGVWNQIGSNTAAPVSGGVLGSWDTTGLASGLYNLRLTVADEAGNVSYFTVNDLLKPVYTGIFSVATPDISLLSSLVVSSSSQQSTGRIGEGTGDDDIEVEDDRGSFAGWSLTATMTDFFSDSDMISITGMTITPLAVAAKFGSLDGVSAGPVHTFLNDTDPASVMLASSGYGNGVYWNDVDLLLQVPAFSKAGNYNAVVTFSLQ
jgi:hypothetical protein